MSALDHLKSDIDEFVRSTIETERIVFNQHMCGLQQHMTRALVRGSVKAPSQIGQAQGSLASLFIAVWPEEGCNLVTRVDPLLHGKVGQQRQNLAGLKGERLLRVAHFWRSEQPEHQAAHFTSLSR